MCWVPSPWPHEAPVRETQQGITIWCDKYSDEAHAGDYENTGDTHSSPESQGGEPREALEESEPGLKVE